MLVDKLVEVDDEQVENDESDYMVTDEADELDYVDLVDEVEVEILDTILDEVLLMVDDVEVKMQQITDDDEVDDVIEELLLHDDVVDVNE